VSNSVSTFLAWLMAWIPSRDTASASPERSRTPSHLASRAGEPSAPHGSHPEPTCAYRPPRCRTLRTQAGTTELRTPLHPHAG
jgi:hypothetical protein